MEIVTIFVTELRNIYKNYLTPMKYYYKLKEKCAQVICIELAQIIDNKKCLL